MPWTQRILKVNLSTLEIEIEDIPRNILEIVIGGKGLGAYLLHKNMEPGIDALHADNQIIIATGPAQGIMSIAGRYCIVTKSPHSGIFIDSHVGGYLGPELKFAGYDAMIISGKAVSPVYIEVHDDNIQIKSAEPLWGKDIIQTTDEILSDFGSKARVIAIGPAGENQVHIACTNSDYYRTAARGGIGMLFGSKNLKAIAIRGSNKVTADNAKATREIRSEINARAKESHDNGHKLPMIGTSWLAQIASKRDQIPTYNYQKGEYEHIDEIKGETIDSYYGEKIQKRPCYRCTLACSYVIDTDYDWADGIQIQHPEYESIGLLGSNLGITDIETLVRLNHTCNILGLDTISTGSSISWFIECGQKDVVPEKYQDEIIEFGDGEKILQMIHKIAFKEGVGEVLGKGVKRAAEIFGSPTEEWAVHVRGLELPAWDPRGKLGLGLSYITSNVGGSHLRGWPRTSDIPSKESLPVVDSMIEEQDLKILKDSLIMCHFTHSISPPLTLEDTAEIYQALTGIETSKEDMRKRAQIIWILARQFNTEIWKEQAPRDTDLLPHRLMKDGLPSGIAKGKTAFISLEDMNKSLDYFYGQRKCRNDGRATDEEWGRIKSLLHL